jgi:homoserine kinase
VKRVRLDVPATSANLGPGFDSLGMALDLADSYTVEFHPGGSEVLVDWATCAEAEVARSDHYACQGYHAYAADTGLTLPGASFTREGQIPVGKGFGSSAAAIVAGLAAGAHAAGEKDGQDRIVRLAAKLEGHPDNSTAAILGGVTVAFCNGEEVHALNIVNHVSLGVALFVPEEALPTVEARRILPADVSVQDAVYNLSRSTYLATALAWGRWEHVAPAMRDRLHQPYRTQLIPGLECVISSAVDAGAYGAALSGGGPAVIALGPRERIHEIAERMEEAAHEQAWPGHSLQTQVRSRGVQVTELDG